MKTSSPLLVFLLFSSLTSSSLWSQYGFGVRRPNESTVIHMQSVDKGLLIPSHSLTGSITFRPIIGTSSVTHNGLLVFNTTNSPTTHGLTPGFYYWENHPSEASGRWHRLNDSSNQVLGTVTNASLRWNGSAWVEDTSRLTNGSNQVTITTDLLVGRDHSVKAGLEVTGTSTLTGNVRLAANLTVSGNTTLVTTTLTGDAQLSANLAVSGLTTLTGKANIQGVTTLATTTISNDLSVTGTSTLATTTFGGAVVDVAGNTGVEGQILSTTATGTRWITPRAYTFVTNEQFEALDASEIETGAQYLNTTTGNLHIFQSIDRSNNQFVWYTFERIN